MIFPFTTAGHLHLPKFLQREITNLYKRYQGRPSLNAPWNLRNIPGEFFSHLEAYGRKKSKGIVQPSRLVVNPDSSRKIVRRSLGAPAYAATTDILYTHRSSREGNRGIRATLKCPNLMGHSSLVATTDKVYYIPYNKTFSVGAHYEEYPEGIVRSGM